MGRHRDGSHFLRCALIVIGAVNDGLYPGQPGAAVLAAQAVFVVLAAIGHVRRAPASQREGRVMPAHVRSGLRDADIRVIAESEVDFTIAIDVPKVAIARHRRFLELLPEAGAGLVERDG